MTTIQHGPVETTTMTDREPTAAEIDAWRREAVFVSAEEFSADDYPRLNNLSSGFMYRGMIRPVEPTPPKYVAVRMPEGSLEWSGAVAQWNMLWEAAQYRRRMMDEDALLPQLAKLADLGDLNLTLVPRTRSRYFEYSGLVHLLPKATLERFGLPLLRSGQWPFMADFAQTDRYLPADFRDRLAKAWAWTVWPHLVSGSRISAFSPTEPIRVLAHNLDYWVPAVTAVIQDRLRAFPEVDKGIEPCPVHLEDGAVLPGALAGNPRMGGPVWMGKNEAADALVETVDSPDAGGSLRALLDAVKSNRVRDDFSDHWSFAREDFERKLHHKRAKISVRFVEMTDTIPVQGPESQVLGGLVTNDFLALLDDKNRQIVVLLNSGVTKGTEIAKILGYANHSAVSKRLTQIRKAAARHFDLG